MILQPRYYVYRHFRLDIGETFYIGIGSKRKDAQGKTQKQLLARAYNKRGRSIFWKRIVTKTDYKVDIIYQSNFVDKVKQKEIEFIAFYGRRDLGLGTLVNMTNGGDGMSECRVYKLCKSVYLLNSDLSIKKEFDTIIECAKYVKGNRHVLSNVCRNKKLIYKSNLVCFKDDYNDIIKNVPFLKDKFVVHQFDKNNNFIREYKQIKDVEEYGFNKSNVSRCLTGDNYSHKNYKFKRITV